MKMNVWFFTLIFLFILPSLVGAHSYLELSSPKAESTVEESPTGVWVQFSEPIDTRVSQLRLENEAGEVIEGEQYSVDNSSITLRLPPLENGVYYVFWQILALDSHVTDGSFRFFVEAELPPEPMEEPVQVEEPEIFEEQVDEEDQQVDERVEEQSNWSVFNRFNSGLRIIDIITVMLIGGWVFFHGVIWRKKDVENTQNKKTSTRNLEKWLFFTAFLFIIGTSFGHIILRAIFLTQTSFVDSVLWQTVWVLFTTTIIGKVSIIKPILAVILFVLTFSVKPRTTSKGIIILLLLVTFGYTGHAYHSEMILMHTLHMLAIVIWFGGLIGFVVYSFLTEKSYESIQYLHQRIKLFSKIALASVVVVIVTGVLLSDVYLESWANLLSTDYGQILLWKVGLFFIIIIIAALHRFLWLANLKKIDSADDKQKQLTYLFWGLRVELVLVVIVLVIAGMLSTASPPADIHGDHHYYYH